MNGNRKLPIVYFLIDSLNAAERANLILKSLTFVHKTGATIISLTFDVPSTNFTTAKLQGVDLEVCSIKIFLKLPITKQNVKIFPNCSHMIKLVCNTLVSYGSI